MFQSFRVELIYQEQLEMAAEICRLWCSKKNIQLLFVCKAQAVQQLFVFEQTVIVNIIIHICAALARIEVRGEQVFLLPLRNLLFMVILI
jgi:hypothetical protein